MADDLQDEWWMSPEDENGENETKEDKKPQPSGEKKKSKAVSKKRHTVGLDDDSKETTSEPPKKKKKKANISNFLEEVEAKACHPSDLTTAMSAFYKDILSTLELADATLEEKYFTKCSEAKQGAVSYLKEVIPKWKKKLEKVEPVNGAPLLLIVCSSALRATQLSREIEVFKLKECKTAKLFAKHMKMKEQVAFLSKSQIHLGVGTPQRMAALMEDGALKLSQTSHVILDWSWRSVKLKRMVDCPDVKPELFKLLKNYVFPWARKGKMKIGLL